MAARADIVWRKEGAGLRCSVASAFSVVRQQQVVDLYVHVPWIIQKYKFEKSSTSCTGVSVSHSKKNKNDPISLLFRFDFVLVSYVASPLPSTTRSLVLAWSCVYVCTSSVKGIFLWPPIIVHIIWCDRKHNTILVRILPPVSSCIQLLLVAVSSTFCPIECRKSSLQAARAFYCYIDSS